MLVASLLVHSYLRITSYVHVTCDLILVISNPGLQKSRSPTPWFILGGREHFPPLGNCLPPWMVKDMHSLKVGLINNI